jgi:DNA-binding CsgD family transcriptional regulator
MSTNYSLAAFKTIAGNPGQLPLPLGLEKTIETILPSFDQVNPSAAFLFVFDFTTMRYLFVSESVKEVTGYSAEQWKRGGIDWVTSALVREDEKRLVQVHAALFGFYYALPVAHRKNCRYAYEYHLRRKDDKPIWLLQQGAFIEVSSEGMPVVTFDILTDITPFKRDKTMTLRMVAGKRHGTFHFPADGNVVFTQREMDILRLLAHDLSSKQIAKKLFVSSHTVDTHRRNMLKKAGKKDATSLVYYARERGLI